MNVGYESDELKPHVEPVEDYNDPERIGESSPHLCFLFLHTRDEHAS